MGSGALKKTAAVLNRTEEIVLCLTLLEMSVLAFIQVITRYIFGTSITWAEEILRYQICFVAFFGADIGLRYGAHIKTEAINLLLPNKLRPLINAFVYLSVFAFCSVLVYYGTGLVLTVAESGQMTAAIRIPKFWIYLPIPLGACLMTVRSAAYFVTELRQFAVQGRPRAGAL
jgi:TRAP-type C4-dicarboxylate transport system permease small subunit